MRIDTLLKSLGFKGYKKNCSTCSGGGGKTTFEKWKFNRLIRVKSSNWSSWEKTTFNYKLTNKKFANKQEFEMWYNSL